MISKLTKGEQKLEICHQTFWSIAIENLAAQQGRQYYVELSVLIQQHIFGCLNVCCQICYGGHTRPHISKCINKVVRLKVSKIIHPATAAKCTPRLIPSFVHNQEQVQYRFVKQREEKFFFTFPTIASLGNCSESSPSNEQPHDVYKLAILAVDRTLWLHQNMPSTCRFYFLYKICSSFQSLRCCQFVLGSSFRMLSILTLRYSQLSCKAAEKINVSFMMRAKILTKLFATWDQLLSHPRFALHRLMCPRYGRHGSTIK